MPRRQLPAPEYAFKSEAEVEAFDHEMMGLALELAREAGALGEVPVGAVIARGGRVIARGYNLRETLNDPTAHAERIAITRAGRALGSWRLDDCWIYVTLEPCAMCAGAIVLARPDRLIYGAADPKAGACASLYQLVTDPRLNHRVAVTTGVLEAECGEILTRFFQERRSSRKIGP
jgi:tRNA(adenine34) deaminase